MFNMKGFSSSRKVPKAVDLNDEIPEAMDVFQRSEEQFLPPGKTLEELTPEELIHMRRQYKYDYYKPGVYQGITGIGRMM